MEFVELPPQPARKLMRDVWGEAAGKIRRATLEHHADTAPSARPWVCLYSEDAEDAEYRPLLSHKDVRGPHLGNYYHPRLMRQVDYRPAVSVRGGFLSQMAVADLAPVFEAHCRGVRVFVRYTGDGSEMV